jgi:eukaryotic-like serine/threonine-protein kinase
MSLTPGTRLGPYEIVSAIGAGGMGEVYRARDARLSRDVAIKVIPREFAFDPSRLRRFQQEAQTVAALSHPGIVGLYDIGEHDSVIFLVSELIEGETLRQALASGALSARRAIDVAAQVARGLAAAHAKGQVHRDIKPENIMLQSDGRARILDFGLAKALTAERSNDATATSLTDPGSVMGTIGYMSPEQARGLPVDGRSDVFSLGVVLFEILTGRRPFERETSADTISAILKEDPPHLTDVAPKVPGALERIVMHCLEKTPERRYDSAGDLAFSLESLSTTSGATALPAEIRTPWRPALPVIAASALVVCLAVLAGHWLWPTPTPAAPTFHRLTFRAGTVYSAMFTPDEQTILYSAAWQDEPLAVSSTRVDSHESRPLGIENAVLAAMSSSSELALIVHPQGFSAVVGGAMGTLARVPLAGGASREILNDVLLADWLPDGNLVVVRQRQNGGKGVELPIGHAVFDTSDNVLAMRVSPAGDQIALAVHPPGFGSDGAIVVIDRAGKSRVLAPGQLGDFADVAWAPSGREVWYDFGIAGSRELKAVDLGGRTRTLLQVPGRLQLFDVSRNGRALINETNWHVDVHGVMPNTSGERDYSWLDASEVDDVTPDGKVLIITEFGDGGDPRRWTVYLRKTDGSPAVRLGDGQAMAISPDGSHVLAMARSRPPELVAYPTGPGDTIRIPSHGIGDYFMAVWLPDGGHVLLTGVEPGHGQRCYVESLDGSEFRAVSPEGFTLPLAQPGGALLPDGRSFTAIGADNIARILPLDGGAPRTIAGIEPFEAPIRWTDDGRSVYVTRLNAPTARVVKIDLATGARTHWKDLAPPSSAGARQVYAIQLSPEHGWYFYSSWHALSDLYEVDGIK